MDLPPDSKRAKEAGAQKAIDEDYREFRSAAKMWSGAYHCLQFGSAGLSAAAALVLKTDFVAEATARNDWGAALAAAAAFCITLLTTGRFKEKWEANRVAAFAVRDLNYDMKKTDPDTDLILGALQRIGLTRNNLIVGMTPSWDVKSRAVLTAAVIPHEGSGSA